MKFIIILFVFISTIGFSQENQPLSKSQMYADFDFLVSKIEQVSPHLIPKKILFKDSILTKIKGYRKEIDTINSSTSFWYLISRSLQTCQDGHTSIRTKNENFTAFKNFKLNLPFKYINGDYISIKPFSYLGKVYPIGTIVTKVNGVFINKFMQSQTQFRYFMKFDVSRKQYYYDAFYTTDVIALAGKINITLQNLDNTNSQLKLKTSDTISILKTNADYSSIKYVDYWQAEKILYIRVPAMDYDDIDFYKSQIINQAKDKQIDKIIIDIRNNLGGSDAVWKEIYETIIDKPVSYSLKLIGNNPNYMLDEYLNEHEIDLNKIKKEKLSYLDNKEYYVFADEITTLNPTEYSIHHKGKIIVIGNENIYSSAGSCMLLPNSNKNDNFISLGRKTGRFLGGGFDPIEMKLPNSKIDFSIEPAIDVTNCKKTIDIMHDNYEYEIPISIKEFEDKFNYNGSIWSKEFMLQNDPFIKKAIEL